MSVCAVIPAYNAEAYIGPAIDSVLSQSVPVEEIIVVDDGSKDGTCAVVESYGSRVRLLRQKNQGPSAARNLAVGESNSEFVAFLDADDLWHPQKIERQLEKLANSPGAVLCYTGLLNFSDVEGWERPSKPVPLAEVRAELRLRNPRIVPSSVLVPRAMFLKTGGFDTGLKGSEDWDFAIAMHELGSFCVVEDPLTLYRSNGTGLSADPEWMFQETQKMLNRRLLNGLSGPSRWAWRRRILSFHAYTAALNARALNRRDRERYWMGYSVKTWPSPMWRPERFKAFMVTLRNTLMNREH
jgi:glycosyltransferase involved in cell wall biosynthesis